MKKTDINIRKRISVKSSTDNLVKIREFVKSVAKKVGINEDTTSKIILATDEACTNVIKHAYKYSKSKSISVNVSYIPKKFTVSIIDSGEHFNPNSIPEPDLKKYYEERRVGGLGMFLMKKLMDEVKYSHPNAQKNKVTLVKYLK